MHSWMYGMPSGRARLAHDPRVGGHRLLFVGVTRRTETEWLTIRDSPLMLVCNQWARVWLQSDKVVFDSDWTSRVEGGSGHISYYCLVALAPVAHMTRLPPARIKRV